MTDQDVLQDFQNEYIFVDSTEITICISYFSSAEPTSTAYVLKM